MRFDANLQVSCATSVICMLHSKTRKTYVDAEILESLSKRKYAVMHVVRLGGIAMSVAS